MSENTSNTTTVKPHFKLWAKKVEANEVTPQHPHKPFPGWVYGVLFVIFDIIVVTALKWAFRPAPPVCSCPVRPSDSAS